MKEQSERLSKGRKTVIKKQDVYSFKVTKAEDGGERSEADHRLLYIFFGSSVKGLVVPP